MPVFRMEIRPVLAITLVSHNPLYVEFLLLPAQPGVTIPIRNGVPVCFLPMFRTDIGLALYRKSAYAAIAFTSPAGPLDGPSAEDFDITHLIKQNYRALVTTVGPPPPIRLPWKEKSKSDDTKKYSNRYWLDFLSESSDK